MHDCTNNDGIIKSSAVWACGMALRVAELRRLPYAAATFERASKRGGRATASKKQSHVQGFLVAPLSQAHIQHYLNKSTVA
eukprot:669598-Pelagomonas_calceolata.AAC.1